MEIAVAGGHGFIGSALIEDLRGRGHTVRRLTRRATEPARGRDDAVTGGAPGGLRDISWDPPRGQLAPPALEGVGAVVNLAGAGVGDRRWTAAYRRTIRESRTGTSGLLARTVAQLDSRPALVQASAVGYYGDRGDEPLDETSAPGDDFLAGVVRDWEDAAAPAAEAGARVVHLRSGIVLAPSGGALGRLLPLIRLGLGGPLGGGRQWWPWITLPDEIAVIRRAIGDDDAGPGDVVAGLSGPVNAVAPGLATNLRLTRALASAVRRPAVVPVPSFALRAAVGGFADELLASRKLAPAALREAGFTWRHETPESAADWIAAGPR